MTRALIVTATILATIAVTTPASTAAPSTPPLRLVAGSSSVTLDRFPGFGVFLEFGTHVVAGNAPFEVRATRRSYSDPIVAAQIVNGRSRTLPAGLIQDFAGLSGFLHVKLTDATGATVLEQDQSFCPNGETRRSRPDAPDTSPYPWACSVNPFTLGGVWGIQKGWSTATTGRFSGAVVDIPEGNYTAQVGVPRTYQDLFGIPTDQANVTVQVTVRNFEFPGGPGGLNAQAAAPQPNAARPTGDASVPRGPKPDLRSLPAWRMDISPDSGKDYLRFAANVWNAGPSPLVVDGFRRSGEDIMDAYQYFYDSAGRQIGYAPTGTLDWDERDGHHHWHFTDFASYRLLNSTQTEVVRSQKEAFCLAATDAIDYTVKNANWKPMNTDLHTACGDEGSIAVREVLDVGSGDTYVQSLPGQSFDITDLPNGTYYVQVIANPDNKLYEANLNNNVSLRQVILGGTPGARTVTVPPHELIDAP